MMNGASFNSKKRPTQISTNNPMVLSSKDQQYLSGEYKVDTSKAGGTKNDDSLLNYITDLKKVACSNKNKRQGNSSNPN